MAILVYALLLFVQLRSTLAGAPVVQLGKTEIVGRENFVHGLPLQEFFGGIPFAEAPTGPLRFAPPVPRPALDVAKFDASQYSIPCPQTGLPANTSEDCLSVNVLRPTGIHAGSGLPVYAWIFGGGFTAGEPSLYNATAIVLESMLRGTPIVYVSINYRVGPFGFPQGVEATARGALNLGLKDQLAGLEWIHQNIAAFGGNPSKVTVGGGSAGAISIANLMLNSGLERYIRGAILESGSQNTLPLLPGPRRDLEWQNFVSATPECAGVAPNKTFDCLREASVDTLIQSYVTAAEETTELFPFMPVIDGSQGIIPELPSKMLAAGKFSRIPFIAGTDLDDGTVFVPTATSSDQDILDFFITYADPLDPNGTPVALEQALNTLLKLYPNDPALGSPFGTGNDTFGLGSMYKRVAAMAVDIAFSAPRRALAQAASHFGVDAFCYLFTDPQSVVVPSEGVAHGNEINYTYGVTFLAGEPQPAASLSRSMLDYWISFVVSQNPNDGKGSARPQWKKFTPLDNVVIQLQGANVTMLPDTYREEGISYINSAPSVFNH